MATAVSHHAGWYPDVVLLDYAADAEGGEHSSQSPRWRVFLYNTCSHVSGWHLVREGQQWHWRRGREHSATPLLMRK